MKHRNVGLVHTVPQADSSRHQSSRLVGVFSETSIKEKTKAFILLGILLGVIIALFVLWIGVADPFCWNGYIATDGNCAWE